MAWEGRGGQEGIGDGRGGGREGGGHGWWDCGTADKDATKGLGMVQHLNSIQDERGRGQGRGWKGGKARVLCPGRGMRRRACGWPSPPSSTHKPQPQQQQPPPSPATTAGARNHHRQEPPPPPPPTAAMIRPAGTRIPPDAGPADCPVLREHPLGHDSLHHSWQGGRVLRPPTPRLRLLCCLVVLRLPPVGQPCRGRGVVISSSGCPRPALRSGR